MSTNSSLINCQLEATFLRRGERDDAPDPREGGREVLPKVQRLGEQSVTVTNPHIFCLQHPGFSGGEDGVSEQLVPQSESTQTCPHISCSKEQEANTD